MGCLTEETDLQDAHRGAGQPHSAACELSKGGGKSSGCGEWAGVLAVAVHLAKPVQQIATRDADPGESQGTIVDSVQTNLRCKIWALSARHVSFYCCEKTLLSDGLSLTTGVVQLFLGSASTSRQLIKDGAIPWCVSRPRKQMEAEC